MSKPSRTLLSIILGVAFLGVLLVIAILKPQPTSFQYDIFRTVLALAGGMVATVMLGFIEVSFGKWLKAGGGLAVFAVLYFLNPAKLVDAEQNQNPTPTVQSKTFSGRVFDATTKKPIAGAEIFVAQDQLTPEMVSSDSDGVFVVLVHPTTSIMRLDVSAKNYVPQVRTVPPMRSGPEEFDLQHTNPPASQHIPKPTANLPPPTQGGPIGTNQGQSGTCQNTLAPCVGLNNGTVNIFTLGTPPPPVRNVDPNEITDAIATLRVAPERTKLRIDGVGSSPDMDSFVSQLIELFHLGGWDAFRGNRTGVEFNISSTSSGTSTSQGEGIRCAFSNQSAYFIATRALQQIGYFCDSDYSPQSQTQLPADVFISVGAPTH
jgi:hypothetical protein